MKMQKTAYEKNAKYENEHFWFVGRQEICLAIIDDVIKKSSVNSILDYGCGTGGLLRALQQKYTDQNIYGADISEDALNSCRIKGVHNLIDLNKNKLDKIKYDLIICMDVLEHIHDDRKLLMELKELLSEKGKMLLTVPAYEMLWSGEDFVSNHFRRYKAGRLRRLFEVSGLQTIKLSYFNTFLFLPIVLMKIIKRVCFPKSMYQSDLEEVNSHVNQILSNIFSAEKQFLRHVSFPFGASIIALIEKKDI